MLTITFWSEMYPRSVALVVLAALLLFCSPIDGTLLL